MRSGTIGLSLVAAFLVAGLAGCALPPPPPPVLVAVPGPGKTAQLFAQDDVVCRLAAQTAVPAVSPSGAPVAVAPVPATYLQCMTAHGNIIQALPSQPPVDPYAFPYAYPYAGYGAWPSTGLWLGWGDGWGPGPGWVHPGWGYPGWGPGWGHPGWGQPGWGHAGWGGGGWAGHGYGPGGPHGGGGPFFAPGGRGGWHH